MTDSSPFPPGCPQPREDRCCLLSHTTPMCRIADAAAGWRNSWPMAAADRERMHRIRELAAELYSLSDAALRPDAENGSRPLVRLTARQCVVMDLLCEGDGNKQIARRLGISEKTVRNHAYDAYRKLGGAQSAVQAALRWQALRESMTEVDGAALRRALVEAR